MILILVKKAFPLQVFCLSHPHRSLSIIQQILLSHHHLLLISCSRSQTVLHKGVKLHKLQRNPDILKEKEPNTMSRAQARQIETEEQRKEIIGESAS